MSLATRCRSRQTTRALKPKRTGAYEGDDCSDMDDTGPSASSGFSKMKRFVMTWEGRAFLEWERGDTDEGSIPTTSKKKPAMSRKGKEKMIYSDDEVVGVPGEGSSESCAFVSSRTRSAAVSSSMNPISLQSFLAPSRPLFIARSTLRPSSPDHPQAFINPMPTQQEIIEYYNLQLEKPRNQDVDDAFGDVGDEMDQDYSQDDEMDQGFSLCD
jgi:hypothetical protein